jgi:hypothetical protein
MAIDNNISIGFTAQQETDLLAAINTIKTIITDKVISLTPKQRQQYGRVKYEKEIWIDKVKVHIDQNPSKVPDYVDVPEFQKDYAAHKTIGKILNVMEAEFDKLDDTNLLLGYDLDFNAHAFYRSIQTAARNNDPGAKAIYDDLKQQFAGQGKKKKDE